MLNLAYSERTFQNDTFNLAEVTYGLYIITEYLKEAVIFGIIE